MNKLFRILRTVAVPSLIGIAIITLMISIIILSCTQPQANRLKALGILFLHNT